MHVEASFEPNRAHKALYDDQHRIYRGLYEAIAKAGQYQALADFVAKYY